MYTILVRGLALGFVSISRVPDEQRRMPFFLNHIFVSRHVVPWKFNILCARRPKLRNISSKKVRRIPTVAEQSQIYIKHPRVSGALLTIIPIRDCRAVEYGTTDQSRDEIMERVCSCAAEQTYRLSFNSSSLFIHIMNSRTPNRRHIFAMFGIVESPFGVAF